MYKQICSNSFKNKITNKTIHLEIIYIYIYIYHASTNLPEPLYTNILGKGMNPNILPPAIGKIVGQTWFFSLGEATSLGEGKL